ITSNDNYYPKVYGLSSEPSPSIILTSDFKYTEGRTGIGSYAILSLVQSRALTTLTLFVLAGLSNHLYSIG
ncbi:MAG: hypothetical protein IKF42_09245, partial [Mogibacterium sp.]|nr:hypothetical protein [Mogibacterium sp.]